MVIDVHKLKVPEAIRRTEKAIRDLLLQGGTELRVITAGKIVKGTHLAIIGAMQECVSPCIFLVFFTDNDTQAPYIRCRRPLQARCRCNNPSCFLIDDMHDNDVYEVCFVTYCWPFYLSLLRFSLCCPFWWEWTTAILIIYVLDVHMFFYLVYIVISV